MSKVVFKKGLFANLPQEEQDNVLLFATDVGRLFQGNGTGKKLTEYSDVMTGYVDLADLQAKNPSIANKLYITDDKGIYIYKNNDYVQLGGTGGGNVDLTGYMDKATYASDVNAGNVKKSDSTLKVDGVDNAKASSYYGKDTAGNIGFHELPTGGGNLEFATDQDIDDMFK